MRFFFADDSRQDHPSRSGMGPLVAIGGCSVDESAIRELEGELEGICAAHGFPRRGDPASAFKWSPGRELWMHQNLRHPARADFFQSVLEAAGARDVTAVVVIEDTERNPATGADTPELDVTTMFLERADSELGRAGTTGVVVVDRPSGGRQDEVRFLLGCLETLESGTAYHQPEHILTNVLAAPSKLLRTLQLADVITGCTLAYVAGEKQYAPTTWRHVAPLLATQWGQVGGVGVKIHPDYRYRNLYHWLFGDEVVWKGPRKTTLPLRGDPYGLGPDDASRSVMFAEDAPPWPPEEPEDKVY